ncbi:MAG: hypothetical protein AB8H12_24890 [Lewinella sp.]
MATKLHKESQRFNDKVVLGILGLGTAAALVGTLNALFVSGEPYFNAFVYFVFALVMGGWMYWLISLRLKVSVSKKSIKYTMSTPLNKVSRKIKWKEVQDCTIVKTPKIAQWHGANLTYGAESRFSLSGRSGLSLTTKNGRRYFIGCDNVDELQRAMGKLMVG